MNRKEKAQQVHQELLAHFGQPQWTRRPAMDELILTVLSQNTNDNNRDVAYQAMRNKYPNWSQVREADQEVLIETIRFAGLANQKGPRIQAILDTVYEKEGDFTLEFLKNMEPEDAKQWLVSLKGVGPKTASIVMLFSLDMPAFPVDTHVHRVSERIGLRDDKITANKAHTALARLYEPEQYGAAHLLLIQLGREICKARKPECGKCPVYVLCEYDEKTS